MSILRLHNIFGRAFRLCNNRLLLAAAVCAGDGASPSSLAQSYTPPASVEFQWEAQIPQLKLHIFKALPHFYPTATIAVALAFAGLSTNDQVPTPPNSPKGTLWFDRRDNSSRVSISGPINPGLIVRPQSGTISFNRYLKSVSPLEEAEEVPNDEAVASVAWQCASAFGINRNQLVEFGKRIQKCEPNTPRQAAKTDICARGIVLARLVDGNEFYAGRDFITSGFVLDLTSHEQIQDFQLIWPELEVVKTCTLPSREQVEQWMRQGKAAFVPDEDPATLKRTMTELNAAPKVTICSIKPYYTPTSAHGDTIGPVLKLEMKTATATAYLLCPVKIDMP